MFARELSASAPSWRRRIFSTSTFRALLGLLFFATISFPSVANQHLDPEYLVKAAFLYNFAKFVRWPVEDFPEKGEQIELCVLAEDRFQPELRTINGKSVQGRTLSLRSVADIEEVDRCHLLFLTPSQDERVEDVINRLQTQHVLTVSDIHDFARRGGIIGLVTIDNKIRFEINLDAARRAGLKISSNLLRLATIVGGES